MYTIKISKIVSYMIKKVNVIETCMRFKMYNLHTKVLLKTVNALRLLSGSIHISIIISKKFPETQGNGCSFVFSRIFQTSFTLSILINL